MPDQQPSGTPDSDISVSVGQQAPPSPVFEEDTIRVDLDGVEEDALPGAGYGDRNDDPGEVMSDVEGLSSEEEEEPQSRPRSTSVVETETVTTLVGLDNLRFAEQFAVLANMEKRSEAVGELAAQPMDVDRWELVLSPAEYLGRFKDTLATVQLMSRMSKRRMHTTYHRGPKFNSWLLLAEANHQLWVDPKYKERFFDKVNEYQVAQPGKFNNQANLGNVHVPTSVFIHCLLAPGCDAIRLKAYGQKMPLVDRFLKKEPAESVCGTQRVGHRQKLWLILRLALCLR